MKISQKIKERVLSAGARAWANDNISDYIEDFLLRRAIDGYWGRKQREEENKRRVKESLKQFNTNYAVTLCGFFTNDTIKNIVLIRPKMITNGNQPSGTPHPRALAPCFVTGEYNNPIKPHTAKNKPKAHPLIMKRSK